MDLIQRGSLSKIEKSDGKTSKLLVSFHDGDSMIVEHYEPWGFAGYPKGDAEAVVLTPFGNFDSAFCALVHDRKGSRPNLTAGESALYASNSSYFKVGEQKASVVSEGVTIEGKSGVAIKAGEEELIAILSDLVTALNTASLAGKIPVTNELLPAILQRLTSFKMQ